MSWGESEGTDTQCPGAVAATARRASSESVEPGCDIGREVQHSSAVQTHQCSRRFLVEGEWVWRISGERRRGSAIVQTEERKSRKRGASWLQGWCSLAGCTSQARRLAACRSQSGSRAVSHFLSIRLPRCDTQKQRIAPFRLRHGNSTTGSPLTFRPALLPVSGAEQRPQRPQQRHWTAKEHLTTQKQGRS